MKGFANAAVAIRRPKNLAKRYQAITLVRCSCGREIRFTEELPLARMPGAQCQTCGRSWDQASIEIIQAAFEETIGEAKRRAANN